MYHKYIYVFLLLKSYPCILKRCGLGGGVVYIVCSEAYLPHR